MAGRQRSDVDDAPTAHLTPSVCQLPPWGARWLATLDPECRCVPTASVITRRPPSRRGGTVTTDIKSPRARDNLPYQLFPVPWHQPGQRQIAKRFAGLRAASEGTLLASLCVEIGNATRYPGCASLRVPTPLRSPCAPPATIATLFGVTGKLLDSTLRPSNKLAAAHKTSKCQHNYDRQLEMTSIAALRHGKMILGTWSRGTVRLI
jgi:hypothetical protein